MRAPPMNYSTQIILGPSARTLHRQTDPPPRVPLPLHVLSSTTGEQCCYNVYTMCEFNTLLRNAMIESRWHVKPVKAALHLRLSTLLSSYPILY